MPDSPHASFLRPEMGRPHLVLLGAGASRAALPRGDRNGRTLPLMSDFAETLGLGEIFEQGGVAWRGRNFEDIYSAIHNDASKKQMLEEVERIVRDYFFSLSLPDEPTLYDVLVLSLREKDVIATFNWDPFLIQAFRRNPPHGKHPTILHLHGCVALKYVELADGKIRSATPDHVDSFDPRPWKWTPILFPVRQKDYQLDPFIRMQWKGVRMFLREAYVFTVFGYSAPASDVEAKELLMKAWGSPEERNLEEVEIVDIRSEDDLRASWAPFIHSHHYRVHDRLEKSCLQEMPRRSVEGVWGQKMECWWLDPNPIPPLSALTLVELQEWFGRLHKREDLESSLQSKMEGRYTEK